MINTIKMTLGLFNKKEKRNALIVLCIFIVAALFQTVGVVSILPFMDVVMDTGKIHSSEILSFLYERFDFQSENRFLVALGFGALALIVIGNLITAFSIWVKLKFIWNRNHTISKKLLKKYINQPYVYFLDKHSSDLGRNIIQESSRVITKVLIPMFTIVSKVPVILMIVVVLFLTEPVVSLIAVIIFGGSFALVFVKNKRRLSKSGLKRSEANKMRNKIVTDAFTCIKDVKVSGKEDFFLDAFSKSSIKVANLQSYVAIVGQIPRYVVETLAFGGVIVMVIYFLLTRGNSSEFIPMVSFFAFASYRLMPALQEVFKAITDIRFEKPVLKKIYEDINDISFEEKCSGDSSVESLDFKDSIGLNEVRFFYPNSTKPVLDGIDISIKKNTSVAFVGLTGAGKTTIVDILLGLLVSQEGNLSVDDVTIEGKKRTYWQRKIGYVPQHIYLSDDSVKGNIAFGVSQEDVDMDKVIRAAKSAEIHDFIENELEGKYDEIVGERGVRLSGGQIQRIGIARALYNDPEVLVMDEATSALDNNTEKNVLNALENAAKSKTLIIIAHRLTTVKECDTIYLMEQGKILASGTYSELLEKSEKFRVMASSVEK